MLKITQKVWKIEKGLQVAIKVVKKWQENIKAVKNSN